MAPKKKNAKLDVGEQDTIESNEVYQGVVTRHTHNASIGIVSDILDKQVVHRVARSMWEKELVTKFQKSYMNKAFQAQTVQAARIKVQHPDSRRDDGNVTPKGSHSKSHPTVTNFGYYVKNADSILPTAEYEENEAPP